MYLCIETAFTKYPYRMYRRKKELEWIVFPDVELA